MSVDHAVDIRRIITGLALAAALLLVLWLRGWPLLFVILLVAALGLWEFYSLFWGPTGRIPSRICAIALGWGMLCLTWLNRPQDALVCLGAGFVLAAMTFLFRWDVVEEENAFSASGIFMAGLAYVPLLLLPATYLSTVKLIFVLAAVAVSDTAAYFVGTRFGHHKLWPRVSPNKSSEGAVGSLVACVIFCAVYGEIYGKVGWFSFALLGVAVNAFAQVGDLFESALKRSVHVKDSGSILPGHGGILDRADSFLFAMPMVAVVDQWFFFFFCPLAASQVQRDPGLYTKNTIPGPRWTCSLPGNKIHRFPGASIFLFFSGRGKATDTTVLMRTL